MGPENISNDTAEARAAAGFTSLLVLLLAAERRKDAPLTEFEVAALRDQALARLTPPTDGANWATVTSIRMTSGQSGRRSAPWCSATEAAESRGNASRIGPARCRRASCGSPVAVGNLGLRCTVPSYSIPPCQDYSPCLDRSQASERRCPSCQALRWPGCPFRRDASKADTAHGTGSRTSA